jgi:hypothetical protein
MRFKMRKKLPGRTSLIALVVVAAALLVTQTAVFASNVSKWKLGSYSDTTGAFSYANLTSPTFNFMQEPNNCTPADSYAICGSLGAGTALLVNTKGPVVGNQLNKTITATFTISGAVGAFTYGGEPYCSSAVGGSLPNARLYFDSAPITSNSSNHKTFTNYWWSDATTGTVNLANNTFTVTALVSPTAGLWGDIGGVLSNADATTIAAFNAAASNIKDIGLSFGGGCFFANGVGTTDGTGTFVLTSLTVS